MKRILVTGATGNVGIEVIKALHQAAPRQNVIAGVRNPEKDRITLDGFSVRCTLFNFTTTTTYAPALQQCDILFLLRPPQLSNVDKYFEPLIATAKDMGVSHIVFLSVQGVQHSKFIPHHKIEHLIRESNITYTFLRPAYFMQNFTTTLLHDLTAKKQIFLPAGNAAFTLIDVRDIGAVAARILSDTSAHINTAYDLTSDDILTFKEMAEKLRTLTGKPIQYHSPSLLRFFLVKKKAGIPATFILVMMMLHYLPRFQKTPLPSDWVKHITGREPVSFDRFVSDNIHLLQAYDD